MEYDHSELSYGCGYGGCSPLSVGYALKEWGERMVCQRSNPVSGHAQGVRQSALCFGCPASDDFSTADFIIWYELEPTGKLLGGGKIEDIISHIAEKGHHRGETHSGNLEQVCFEMGKGNLPYVKGRSEFCRIFIRRFS